MNDSGTPVRILVPLDGSPLSETILPALMPLVSRRPVRVTLLRVVSRVDELEGERAYMARTEKSLKKEGVEVSGRLEFGRPAEEILHLAKPADYDFVAMTTHGRSAILRIIMGSVAAQVLRHSDVPVLFHTPKAKIQDWNRIVVGLDGTVPAEAILEDVTRLAGMLQATVHLVRVTLPLLPAGDPYFDPLPVDVEGPGRYVEEIRDRLVRQGILAVPEIRKGFAAQEIVRSAIENDAGLIAMTTLGRGGRARPMERSVAGEVLPIAPCSVLLRRAVSARSGAGKAMGTRMPHRVPRS